MGEVSGKWLGLSMLLVVGCSDDAGRGSEDPNGAGGVPPVNPGSGGSTSSGTPGMSPCEAMVAHQEAACPGTTQDRSVEICDNKTAQLAPIGCGAEWDAYLTCLAQTPIECSNDVSSCDAQEVGYRSCDSQFTASTFCTRSPAKDTDCPATAPYAFGCLAPLPAGCVPRMTGSAARDACCPAFPGKAH